MTNQSSLEPVQQIIIELNNFLLTTHVNPDGDGLGSELALTYFLRKLGKSATILNHSKTPNHYLWLDSAGDIKNFVPERDQKLILDAEAILILDTNQPERLRSMQPFVIQSKAKKIVMDHHLDAHPFADFYVLDEECSSTGEIVYRLLTSINSSLIDRNIAIALYTAIMTDTGSFRYPRTNSETHRIVAHLLKYGVDPTEVYMNTYESWSVGRMHLLGQMLKSLKTAYDGKLAITVCTREMFQETQTTEVETDNFTTFTMSLKGVVIGILVNELHNGVKISFRSKGDIPINELAKEFGGNGHYNAAGARLYNVKIADVIAALIEKSGKYLSSSEKD